MSVMAPWGWTAISFGPAGSCNISGLGTSLGRIAASVGKICHLVTALISI